MRPLFFILQKGIINLLHPYISAFMNPSPALFKAQDVTALHVGPLSFALQPGDNLVLSAPSGTGKTLLLRALADMDVHEGRITLQGKDQADYSPGEWRSRVAYLPAESAWWAETVGEHFPDSDAVDWARLGFDDSVLDWSVSRLSSGERQRLAILRMMLKQPRVLLLDEPTANLDAENTARVEALFAAYLQAQQAAAIWVSHDRAQQQRLGARLLILSDQQWQEQPHDE
jgi:ABC-type iron transport system FetAB ATPase subunit